MTFILLAYLFYCSFVSHILMKQVGEAHMIRNSGWLLAYDQPRTEAFSPTTLEELNSVSMEVDPFPVKFHKRPQEA